MNSGVELGRVGRRGRMGYEGDDSGWMGMGWSGLVRTAEE